jgi:RNA polymerase sigma-70 factor (ECF subfamily)
LEIEEARRAEERDLALRARTDRAAFGALYDRYLPLVHAYCHRRLGSREAAEDATAIAFAKALAAIGRFREEGTSFRAWIFAIAHHVVVDEARARRPTVRLEAGGAWEPAAPGPGPEELGVRGADLARVRTLLAELPPEAARMVELRLADLSDAEIAHVLGRSPGAVRVAMHRALGRLRQLVDPKEPTDA